MPVDYDNPATYRVRHNPTNDSRAFIAACEAFSSERHSVSRPSIRVHQPPGGVSTVQFGEHVTAEETQALLKSRPGKDLRKSEVYGSVICNRAEYGNGESNGAQRAGMRRHQPGLPCFGGEGSALLDRLVTVRRQKSRRTSAKSVKMTSMPDKLAFEIKSQGIGGEQEFFEPPQNTRSFAA